MSTGEVVHVDLNCIFWKGLEFEKPEKVPFRLTQNIVDAFGLSGPEGVFMKIAELSLGIMRRNSETLMSVLESFLYDPLVEWKKKNDDQSGEHVLENFFFLTHLIFLF